MKENTHNDRISRKEAVSKISKYAALTALGTFIMLSPQKAQAFSGIANPGFDALSPRKQTKRPSFPGRSAGKNK